LDQKNHTPTFWKKVQAKQVQAKQVQAKQVQAKQVQAKQVQAKQVQAKQVQAKQVGPKNRQTFDVKQVRKGLSEAGWTKFLLKITMVMSGGV
jgi:hypothetical protein